MPAEDVDYLNEQKETIMQDRGFEYEYEFAWEILYNYVELEEVEAAFNNMNEEFGIDDADGITERAALYIERTPAAPEEEAEIQRLAQTTDEFLCGVRGKTCATSEQVTMAQIQSHRVKAAIGENPPIEQRVN